MGEVRFDDKVAIITGAGAGLGKSHALFLASRGAKVVVNDLGGAMDGTGSDSAAAQVVVDEIKAAGGEATPDFNNVLEGEKIVKTAVDAYGKVDIVVNNAGILRDISLMKQAPEDWDLVLKVHLYGTWSVSKAAFPIMRENKYGRFVMTTSAAGLFGNFGQTNYSAAKLGILGFANTLKLEGAKYDVKVNTIAPIAGTRLTETIMPPNLIEALKPAFVTPLVGLLCSDQCPDTGQVYAVGGGFFAKVAILQAQGTLLPIDKDITPEDILAVHDKIANMEGAIEPKNLGEASMPLMSKFVGK